MAKKNQKSRDKYLVMILVLMSLVFVCCKGTQYLIPTDADVTNAQTHWKGTGLVQLTQGYAIFSDKCTDCHGLKKPQKWTEDEWLTIMQKMGRKAKLDSAQYNLVLHYILAKRETVLAGKK
jgi:hypothetical protein